MSLCIIELNDSEIRVARNAEIIQSSPGYAVIQEDKVSLGEAAARLAHLHPRATNNRYWHNLSQDPLPYASANIRHHADLAYAHLLALHEQAGQPKAVLFAVPGSYSSAQLALLLGLVEASPFQALGLVDSAVAAGAQELGEGTYAYLDIHLHQTILSHLQVSDGVSRTTVQSIDGTGLATIYDACALMIADLFIKQSRFDPQHHAETEQALYDQLPQCLENLSAKRSVLLEIPYQGTQHQARLSRPALLATLDGHYRKIIAAMPSNVHCLVSDRLGRLPGFMEQGADMTVLEPTSIFQTCTAQIEYIRSKGPALSFITRLPRAARPTSRGMTTSKAARPTPVQAETQATHILQGHQAYALTNKPLFLSAQGAASHEKQPDCRCSVLIADGQVILKMEGRPLSVWLNGAVLNHQAKIKVGDSVGFASAGAEYVFINVSP